MSAIKPHEQALRVINGPNGGRLATDAGAIVADEVDDDFGQLFLASPDMARALLLQACTNRVGQPCWCSTTSALADDELHEFRCSEARTALRKAKVLP